MTKAAIEDSKSGEVNSNCPNIVIASLAGGLGNQMYQYATGRRLARLRGVPLKLDVSGYESKNDGVPCSDLEAYKRRVLQVRVFGFNIAAEQATPGEIAALKDKYTGNSRTVSRIVRQLRRLRPKFWWPATHFVERQYRFDPDVLNLSTPCYLGGLWQSEKYFADIREIIRKDFTPCDPTIMDYVRRYISRLRTSPGPIVSLHVRRGELAFAREVLKSRAVVGGPPTDPGYVQKAMSLFDPGCKFLVFSDSETDIAWCKQNIKARQLEFSEGHTPIQDMMLMSACDHHIIASSTFSWWAAWLDPKPGKRVIAPIEWGFPELKFRMVTDDLIPPGWQMI